MTKARIHQRFQDEPKLRADVFENPSGQFRFSEEQWIDTSAESGAVGTGFWTTRYTSGVYDKAESAEREARATYSWIGQYRNGDDLNVG